MIDIESLPTIFEVDDITAITLDSRQKHEEQINDLWNRNSWNEPNKCCLWGTQASRVLFQEKRNITETYTEFYSPRAGGWYIAIANFADVHSVPNVRSIRIPDKASNNFIEIDEPKLALITTWLVKKRNKTGCIPVLNYESIDEAISLEKKLLPEKMLSLLQFFSKTVEDGDSLHLYNEVVNDDFGERMVVGFTSLEVNSALAESEIVNYEKLSKALQFLNEEKYIEYEIKEEEYEDKPNNRTRTIKRHHMTWKTKGEMKADSNNPDFHLT